MFAVDDMTTPPSPACAPTAPNSARSRSTRAFKPAMLSPRPRRHQYRRALAVNRSADAGSAAGAGASCGCDPPERPRPSFRDDPHRGGALPIRITRSSSPCGRIDARSTSSTCSSRFGLRTRGRVRRLSRPAPGFAARSRCPRHAQRVAMGWQRPRRDLGGAARRAAYAAGECDAVAHVAAHELGAATWPIKAARAASPKERARAPGDSSAGGSATSSRKGFASSYSTIGDCGTTSAGRCSTADSARKPG